MFENEYYELMKIKKGKRKGEVVPVTGAYKSLFCLAPYKTNFYVITHFDEFAPVRTMRNGLRVDKQGRRMIARYYVDYKVIAKASAKCHKDDKFDMAIGTKLATDRLFKKMGVD